MSAFNLFIYTAVIVACTEFVELLVNYLMMKKIQKIADDQGIDINEPAHYYCFFGQVAFMGFWTKVLNVIGIKELKLKLYKKSNKDE